MANTPVQYTSSISMRSSTTWSGHRWKNSLQRRCSFDGWTFGAPKRRTSDSFLRYQELSGRRVEERVAAQ